MGKINKNKTEIILAIISLILFTIILINLNNPWLSSLDLSINSKVQGIENNTFTFIAKSLSYFFEPMNCVILLLIISLSLWIKKYKKEAIFIASASVIGAVLIYILKNALTRIRPLNSIIEETGFSFPSGHATISLILFGCLIYYTIKRLKQKSAKTIIIILSSALILLIGFSRIYLRVHWFSDVIAGFLLGVFIISLTIIIQKLIEGFIKFKV
jgi:undecaprenyl-diphosphatase